MKYRYMSAVVKWYLHIYNYNRSDKLSHVYVK